MSAFHDNALIGASGSQGYQISRSVRLRSSANAHFNRTPASAGNQQKWTWSAWVKRGALGANQVLMSAGTNGSSTNLAFLQFNSSDSFQFYVDTGAANYSLVTTQVFRDPSAWYHLVIAFDSTQATASNRTLIYVNGSQITAFSTANYTPQNNTYGINSTLAHNIGRYVFDNTRHFDGYLTEINFIDGQALTPTSFGETDAVTGVWKPKKYTGTYGTNGFYLNFSDNSAATAAAIGKDYSGNGNNWTPNNISVTAGVTYDSMLDVPTQWADGGNGRGNYAVLNPLRSGASFIKNGNLSVVDINTGAISIYGSMYSTDWYAEVTAASLTGVGVVYIGVELESGSAYSYVSDGTKQSPGGNAAYSGNSYTTGDVIGIAYSAAGVITFYKNGVSQGSAFTGLSGAGTGFLASGSSTARTFHANFGQRPFAYTPPSGFKALNTLNLPTPTILKGNQYMDVSLYTGTGSALSVTNSGSMQPDFVWIKGRSSAYEHALFDSVRGARNLLRSNATAAEVLESAGTSLTSFNSSGFSLGTNGATASTNVNGQTFVGWQWKEGATQGFDIVTYTGDGTSARAISHSLGVSPRMVIVKARSLAGENWNCWHTSLNNTAARILLNTTGAVDTGSPTVWGTGGINPTSTTFQVGSASAANGNGTTYVAYLFAEVAGFSRFGSYTGNGSADGPFVFCGFRPRWIMAKVITAATADSWIIYDTARNTYNVTNLSLYANLSNAEATEANNPFDVLSNGFKLRGAGSTTNTNGNTYIFAAFAESPFKNALAR